MSEVMKIVQCTEKELKSIVSESIKKELASFNNNKQQQDNKLLTRLEICEVLKISPATLWRWSKEGKIPSYRIGNRVYYKKDEVEQCLTKSI